MQAKTLGAPFLQGLQKNFWALFHFRPRTPQNNLVMRYDARVVLRNQLDIFPPKSWHFLRIRPLNDNTTCPTLLDKLELAKWPPYFTVWLPIFKYFTVWVFDIGLLSYIVQCYRMFNLRHLKRGNIFLEILMILSLKKYHFVYF